MELTEIIPASKNVVEGFGDSKKAGLSIAKFGTKEYVKVIRLIGQEYGLEFWQQPEVIKDLERTLKSRLQANGEKLADTTPSFFSGRLWHERSFIDGARLSP
jgi:hypothetical protein